MAIKYYRQATGDYVTRMAALKQEIAERSRIGQIHEAREEGRHSNAVETARKMAQDGLPAEVITRYTGLAPEEWT